MLKIFVVKGNEYVKMKFTVRKGKKTVFKLLLAFVVAYLVFLFINQQVKIKIKSDELDRLNQQIVAEKDKTHNIKNKIKDAVEHENSEVGKPGRRVFENVAE